MLDTLLWRCPLCATNDALRHTPRRFRADHIVCTQCQAQWWLRRHPGRGFTLTLISEPPGGRVSVCKQPTAGLISGVAYPLPAWYDAMKASLELTAITDPRIPLVMGEQLYLASRGETIELEVEADDPSWFQHEDQSGPPAITTGRRRHGGMDKATTPGKWLGPGRLFLSNQRLIWSQQSEGAAGTLVSLPIDHLHSAWVMFPLVIMVDLRLYALYFDKESVLKWLTYLHAVCTAHRPDQGRGVKFSPF